MPYQNMRPTINAILLLLLTLPFVAASQRQTTEYSQDRMPGRDMQGRISPLSFEAIPLIGPDTSKAYVDFHYRIPRSFFVFVKPSDPAAPRDEFRARGQLVVELFNSQNVSVASEIRPIALIRTSSMPVNETMGDGDIEGAITFAVSTGEYQIHFEVDDLESGRTSVDKKRTLMARKVTSKSLDLSPPFFANIDTTQLPKVLLAALNHGTNVLFGSARGGMVSQVYCQKSDSVLTVQWTLHGETDNRTPQTVSLSGTHHELVPGRLLFESKEGPVVYRLEESASTWKVLYVPLPLEKLEPGNYKVELKATDGKEKFSHELSFQVIWPGRPMSLMDWDIATEALRFIATADEIDKILSAPSDKGQQLFQAFWKKRDPDTTSSYNEVMVEYYRRVDEATRRFSTTKEADGYKTDRGRIYVLFGPPSNIQRSLLPDQPAREIWTYDNVKKQFVFVEKNKSGNYILTESNKL